MIQSCYAPESLYAGSMNFGRYTAVFLLASTLFGCEDAAERRARYAAPKPAPRPKEITFAPPKQELPPPPKKKEPVWLDYKGEDMRQLTELAGRKVLIVFYAPWSKPSTEFISAVKAYTESQNEKAYAVFINADAYPELANKYKLEAVPTTVLYLEGMKLREMTGAVSASRLEQIIEETVHPKDDVPFAEVVE